MGNVLFQNGVEICPAKTESAETGAPRIAARYVPGSQLGIHVKRRVRKIDIRVGTLELHAGWQNLVAQRQGGFQQSRRAGRTFQMSDIRFHRAERHRAGGKLESRRIAVMLSTSTTSPTRVDVPWPSIRGDAGGREPGILPGARNGEFLADRVGRGDALPFAVAGSPDTAQYGVDLVSVALGIGQAFEHEDGRAFAHHEAIGAFGEWAAAGGRESADFAELDESRGAHVAVDTAGDGHVEAIFDQPSAARHDSCHGRGAGRVRGEVGSMEVEDVGDAAGNTIGQFAGHAVLGDLGEQLLDPRVQLASDIAAHRLRQRGEGGGFFQFAGVLREVHAQRGEVMHFTGEGVAQDHGGTIDIERTWG